MLCHTKQEEDVHILGERTLWLMFQLRGARKVLGPIFYIGAFSFAKSIFIYKGSNMINLRESITIENDMIHGGIKLGTYT